MKLKISIAISSVLLTAVSSLFAGIPPAEQLLPADTLAMVTVPDCAALRAEAQQSPQWLLWHDPAMKPFRDDLIAKCDNRFIAPLEQTLGVQISDYLPLLQGQITLAITQNGWNGNGGSPALLLLLDAKGKDDLLATNLAALEQDWAASGKSARTKILEGVQFSVLTLSSNATPPFAWAFPPDQDNQRAIYIGQFKSLLIVGTSDKAVASVAAHLNGGGVPRLSENAQFTADQMSRFHGAPLYYGWFNGQTFFNALSQTAAAQDSDSDSSPAPWGKILQASGLMDLKSVSFSCNESHEGTRAEFFIAAPESTRHGFFKIITAAPKTASPPPFVPADAVGFWRWRVDGQKSWGELQKTLAMVSPSLLDSLNSIIKVADLDAQTQDPNFDLRQDLLANLGDDWMGYTKAPTGGTLQDLGSTSSLFLFAANNPDQAVLAIKTIAGLSSSGNPPQTRDFLGRKIYTISLPSASGANANGAAAAPRSLYCTASGGYVALSTDVSMIENYLRSDDGKTKPLSRTPGLLDAAQHVGGMENGLFGYQDQRSSARALFAALKNDPTVGSSALNPLAGLPFASAANGLGDLMNFSLLPDFDAIAKYFNFTVYSGASTSEGLDFKIFQPRPPELN